MKKTQIDAGTLLFLIFDGCPSDTHKGWRVVDTILESSDDEDGGGHYTLILEDDETGLFYRTGYSDWDVDNTDYEEDDEGYIIDENGRCDLNCRLTQVEPVEVVVTQWKAI